MSKTVMQIRSIVAVLLACGCANTQPAAKAAPDSNEALVLARQKNAEPLPDVQDAEPAADGSAEIGVAPEPNTEGITGGPAPVHEPRDPDVRTSALEAESGKLGPALRRLQANIARIDREASLEDRMLAHALLGRGYAQRQQLKKAAQEYDRVLAAWADPAAGMQQITKGSAQDREGLVRAGQALNAVGEALFFHAENKRLKADAHKAPKYRGPDTNEGIRKFVNQSVAPWVQSRRRLIDEAQLAYQKILGVRPVPPPRWVVASAAQVAAMFDAFLAEVRTLPVPPEVRNDPKVRSVYEQSMLDAFTPMQEAAAAAHRTCREYARKFHVDTDYSRKCKAR